MAPTKPKGTSTKSPGKQRPRGNTARPSEGSSQKSKSNSSTRTKTRPPKPTKPAKKQKARRSYTEKELGVPQLNMITPKGVQKPRGKKKGKAFVDDPESMMTLLAMVNAEKNGQIESKMMKARQLEELREARQREMESREEDKKAKLEDTKRTIRRDQKSKRDTVRNPSKIPSKAKEPEAIPKKRVSFG